MHSGTQSPPVRLAGYQGSGSILSAALQTLCTELRASEWNLPLDVELDVTAQQEKATDLFASVEQGRRQICYMASGYLSARVSELSVLDLPFSVSDRDAALAALDGQAGAMLREAIARKSGFHVLAFCDNGFRHVSNSVRPIRTPADCQGLTIRTLDSADYRATLNALGFTAVTTDVRELVRAVERGAVQAQENPLTNLLNFGLHKYHRHLSLTQHYFGVLLLVCSRTWYESLSSKQQEALTHAAAVTAQQQRARAKAEDGAALLQLRAYGTEIVPADQLDLSAMRKAIETVVERQRTNLPKELLRAYLPSTAG